MKREDAKILILTAISAIASLYAIFLFLTMKGPSSLGSYGLYAAQAASRDAKSRSLLAVTIYIGILGWVLTVYEIISTKRLQFNGTLRKMIDKEKDCI